MTERARKFIALRERYIAISVFSTDETGEEEDCLYAKLERVRKEFTDKDRNFLSLYDTEM